MGLKTWLGLKKRPDAHRILKRWPEDVAEKHEGLIVTFGIPLKSARSSRDWGTTSQLLGATLRSVFRQTDPRWRVLICGHEMPEIDEVKHPRVEFIATEIAPPQPGDPNGARDDKSRKRFLMGRRLRDLGGGYFMDLDADDLLHPDLVAAALATEHGLVVTHGYIYDASEGVMAPLPGALSVDFDRLSGSSSVIRFDPDEINPDWHGGYFGCAFQQAQAHGYVRGQREEVGRPLRPLSYPAAIYVVNHRENLSFLDKRVGERKDELQRLIRKHAIDHSAFASLQKQFGFATPRTGTLLY